MLLGLVGNADGRRDGVIRWLALAVSIAAFAVTLAIWASFDAASPEFQLVERHMDPRVGIDYHNGHLTASACCWSCSPAFSRHCAFWRRGFLD